MSTRIYQSAQKLINEHDLDPARIDGSGSGGAITKADVEAHLASDLDELPSKEDLIRRGLAEGMTNDEIGELVRTIHGEETKWDAGRVSWTIGNERRTHTDWWKAHGPRVVEDRGVKPGELEVS